MSAFVDVRVVYCLASVSPIASPLTLFEINSNWQYFLLKTIRFHTDGFVQLGSAVQCSIDNRRGTNVQCAHLIVMMMLTNINDKHTAPISRNNIAIRQVPYLQSNQFVLACDSTENNRTLGSKQNLRLVTNNKHRTKADKQMEKNQKKLQQPNTTNAKQ